VQMLKLLLQLLELYRQWRGGIREKLRNSSRST